MCEEPNDNWQDQGKPPSRLTWPIRRIGWFLEKYVLWPVADSFRRIANAFRYRSPVAYIGTTLMLTVTAGAIAAAVYFYNQSEQDPEPLTADNAIPAETVVPPVPSPTQPSTTSVDTTPNSGDGETTLQGVVPNFATAGQQNRNGQQGGNQQGGGANQLPGNVVRPAPKPESPPLNVAHGFATTFARYEIGRKGSAREFAGTATPKLARELRENPPKLPSTGQIPKATVVNVVKGKRRGNSMQVSVSLMRTGTASELRLGLVREKGKGWLVSEVRG